MKKQLIIIGFLLIKLSLACSQNYIAGELKETEGFKPVLYLSYMDSYKAIFSGFDGWVIDSASIDKTGRFAFHPAKYRSGIYRLNIQDIGSNVMAGMKMGMPNENYIIFFLNGSEDSVYISANAAALTRTYQIRANPESSNIQSIRHYRSNLFKTLDTILVKLQEAKGIEDDQFQLVQQACLKQVMFAAKEMQQSLRSFIDTTTDIHAGLVATKYYNLGDNYSQYVPFFDSLAHRWKKIEPENSYLLGLIQEIEDFKKFIPIGSKAPEINLPSITGDSIALSTVKGKLILIDFWASWCGPCRAENRGNLLPLYQIYHEKGFEVFAVSIDSNKQKWERAIEKDGYPWIHVIELNGSFNSAVGKLYKITSIPTTYVIDENGYVLEKNLRGENLKAFLQAYFTD